MARRVPGGENHGHLPLDLGGERHGNRPVLSPGVEPPGLVKEVRRVPGPLGTGAEHGRTLLVPEIPLGKALAGEGGLQLSQLRLGGLPPLAQGGGVDAGDHSHVLRALHPALNLQAGHSHLLQLTQGPGQGEVLQGQRVGGGFLPRPPEGQAAGLGAQAPVAAASPQHGGEKALAAVTHAQRPMAENLQLHGGAGAQVRDGIGGQLPGQHHPGHAQVGAGPDPVQAVDGHLGGGVEGQVWTGPPE